VNRNCLTFPQLVEARAPYSLPSGSSGPGASARSCLENYFLPGEPRTPRSEARIEHSPPGAQEVSALPQAHRRDGHVSEWGDIGDRVQEGMGHVSINSTAVHLRVGPEQADDSRQRAFTPLAGGRVLMR